MIKMTLLAAVLLGVGAAITGPVGFFFVILASHFAIRVIERVL